MKLMQFIEIGTLATPTDFDNRVGELYQVPVSAESTPRQVFDALNKMIKDDDEAITAFSRFMGSQDPNVFDDNIFDDSEIILASDDDNQYYMIFQFMTVVNMMEKAKNIEEEITE